MYDDIAMTTHNALVLQSRDQPLTIETVPRPRAKAGEIVILALEAGIVDYMGEVLDGSRPYPLSLPMTPGSTAIGRIEEVGTDAVGLNSGDLVICDVTIRARDNPNVSILFGIHGGGFPAARKLMDGERRDSCFAVYAIFSLENVYRLNEEFLMNKMGYNIADLAVFPYCLVQFGGLSEIDVKPGETVIVAPATGRYTGAAVAVALVMGATVITVGRNEKSLRQLATIHAVSKRLCTVIVSGNKATYVEALKLAIGKPAVADACTYLSPLAAAVAC